MRIDVKEYIKTRKENLKLTPFKKLLIIQVGDNEASNKYIKGKIRDCNEVGYKATLIKFPDEVEALEIYNYINTFGQNYHGIILQEPAILFHLCDVLKMILLMQ